MVGAGGLAPLVRVEVVRDIPAGAGGKRPVVVARPDHVTGPAPDASTGPEFS